MVFNEISSVIGEVIPLNSSFYTELPPEIVSRFGGLITILQAAGIIFITYIAFLIVRWIFSIKEYKKIRRIDKRINEMDRKLDVLLAERKIKYHKGIDKEEHKKIIKKRMRKHKKEIKRLKKRR
tara:strand:- start:10201 stop:10572 length:372 start_codon:yes stop_codon:yes gene_type:complete